MKRSQTKVMLISSEFPPGPGGIGQHAFSLASGLNNYGYFVKVITISDYATEDEVANFDHQNSHLTVRRYKRYPLGLTYIVRLIVTSWETIKFRPNVVFFTGRFPLWMSFFLNHIFRLTKAQKVCILHGSEINPAKWLERVFNILGIYHSDHIVSVSSFTESLLPKKILDKFPESRRKIIGNGITDEMISSWQRSSNSNKKLPEGLKLLTIGNVIPRKGQHRVVKALRLIKEEHPDAHYHIVGVRRRPELVDEAIQEFGLEKMVTFHGRIKKHDDLKNYYQQADIFFLLSENQSDGDVEGFGIVALEANYFGVPVIGARGCGIESAVKHGFSGVLVDGSNQQEIAEAVEEILGNKEYFSEQSRIWALENHWDKLTKNYAEIIDYF